MTKSKAKTSDYEISQIRGIPISKVSIPESIPCDLCGKPIPVHNCIHGYPYDESVCIDLPARYATEGKQEGVVYARDESCHFDICYTCMDAIYLTVGKLTRPRIIHE